MNGLIQRYFSPADPPAAPAPGGPPPAPASPAAPAAPGGPATPDYFIKPDGTYVEKFWEHPAFPAELKDNMQIRTHKTVADTYGNWLGMHKSQGLDKILIPGKEAKAEEWDKLVWGRLGKPKDPTGYTVPDFAATGLDAKYKASDEEQQAFLSAVHKANLTDGQFQILAGEMNRMLKERLATAAQADATAMETAFKPIKTRLGNEYDNVRTGLEAFLRSTARPEAFESLKGLLDQPGAFEWLEKIAPAFAEAQIDLEITATPANVLADYQAEVAKLTRSKAYTEEFNPEHKATVDRVNQLRKILLTVQNAGK